MPFVNQLEPEAVVRHFVAHPPAGFDVDLSLGGLPMFQAPFDLLTTARPAFQRGVRGLWGYRRWGRLLRPRVRFVGTTVSEYALLPLHEDPVSLAERLVATHAREHPFLIVKDLPSASPLLPAAHVTHAQAFADACLAHGFVSLEGQALAWVPIDFQDIDAHLARLSRGARRDIRRKLRGDRLEVQALATGDALFRRPGVCEEFHALYLEVYQQSEIQFDRLSEAFLSMLLRDHDAGGTVFVYRLDGELVGWNLCFEHAGMLVDKYIGLSYPRARELNLYVVSWMHNLEYARQRGLRFYVAGWTDPQIKRHLGARLTFTRHLVRPRNAALRLALRYLAGAFESDRRWYEEQADAAGRT